MTSKALPSFHFQMSIKALPLKFSVTSFHSKSIRKEVDVMNDFLAIMDCRALALRQKSELRSGRAPAEFSELRSGLRSG